VRVALKSDLAYRAFDALGHRENDTRCAAFLVDWIHAECNADVVVSLPLINFDDFLARFLECLLVNRLIEPHFYLFAESLRFDPFGTSDSISRTDRLGLNGNDHLHAVALRLSKDSNVSNVTGSIQRLDVILHDLVRIQLANFCAHLRQNALLADRCRPRVLQSMARMMGGPEPMVAPAPVRLRSSKATKEAIQIATGRGRIHPQKRCIVRSAAPRNPNRRRTGGYIGNKTSIVKTRFH